MEATKAAGMTVIGIGNADAYEKSEIFFWRYVIRRTFAVLRVGKPDDVVICA